MQSQLPMPQGETPVPISTTFPKRNYAYNRKKRSIGNATSLTKKALNHFSVVMICRTHIVLGGAVEWDLSYSAAQRGSKNGHIIMSKLAA